MRTLVLCMALAATPALAEEPISPSEFRAYAEGWTLHFELDGEPFGSEEFLPDGVTRWRYRDGTCIEGQWRPYGGQVCFYYGMQDEILCWRVLRDDQGLFARLLRGENEGMEVRIVARDKRPLLCGDPGVQS